MTPIRVKVYGLFPLTRRRYLVQAAFGAVFLLLVLILWWLYWPELHDRLSKVKRTPWIHFIFLLLSQTPWILLALVAFKLVEMWFVLRAFVAREEEARRQPQATSPGVVADNETAVSAGNG